jgi:hypothetical protein
MTLSPVVQSPFCNQVTCHTHRARAPADSLALTPAPPPPVTSGAITSPTGDGEPGNSAENSFEYVARPLLFLPVGQGAT